MVLNIKLNGYFDFNKIQAICPQHYTFYSETESLHSNIFHNDRKPSENILPDQDGYFVIESSILIFLTLTEAVIISGLTSKEKYNLARKLDRYCRLVFPFIYLLVGILAFA